MYSMKIKAHKDMNKLDFEEAIEIKSKQWAYGYYDQYVWMKKNLQKSDLHVFLKKNNRNVAYLNLIDIKVSINHDDIKIDAIGIGSVCAICRGYGYGNEIMSLVNEYIIRENKIGLLICKRPLLKFYKNLGWYQLNHENYDIGLNDLKLMIFNKNGVECKIFFIKYDGVIF